MCKCDQIGQGLRAKQGCWLSQIDSQLNRFNRGTTPVSNGGVFLKTVSLSQNVNVNS